MHVFKYSPREGTKAANMENQVEGNEKEKRSQKLIELSNKNQEEYNQEKIGKKEKVLIEEKPGEYWKGHTSDFYVVNIKSDQNLENKIIEVQITEKKGEELIAKFDKVNSCNQNVI